MDNSQPGTAIYLAGHGTKTRPRPLELQHQRILRYRHAVLHKCRVNPTSPVVFLDLHLPAFGMGSVELEQVPGFTKLYVEVQNRRFDTVYIDIDEVTPGLTPDYESTFVRSLLETAGAKVLNAFTDDRGAFAKELKERCGPTAREYEVTDGSDMVNFFPSLCSDILSAALLRELEVAKGQRICDRIDALKRLRPYSGGGTPFVEPILSSYWRKPKSE